MSVKRTMHKFCPTCKNKKEKKKTQSNQKVIHKKIEMWLLNLKCSTSSFRSMLLWLSLRLSVYSQLSAPRLKLMLHGTIRNDDFGEMQRGNIAATLF